MERRRGHEGLRVPIVLRWAIPWATHVFTTMDLQFKDASRGILMKWMYVSDEEGEKNYYADVNM